MIPSISFFFLVISPTFCIVKVCKEIPEKAFCVCLGLETYCRRLVDSVDLSNIGKNTIVTFKRSDVKNVERQDKVYILKLFGSIFSANIKLASFTKASIFDFKSSVILDRNSRGNLVLDELRIEDASYIDSGLTSTLPNALKLKTIQLTYITDLVLNQSMMANSNKLRELHILSCTVKELSSFNGSSLEAVTIVESRLKNIPTDSDIFLRKTYLENVTVECNCAWVKLLHPSKMRKKNLKCSTEHYSSPYENFYTECFREESHVITHSFWDEGMKVPIRWEIIKGTTVEPPIAKIVVVETDLDSSSEVAMNLLFFTIFCQVIIFFK